MRTNSSLDYALASCALCVVQPQSQMQQKPQRKTFSTQTKQTHTRTQQISPICICMPAHAHISTHTQQRNGARLPALKQNQQISISLPASVRLRLAAVIYSAITAHKSRRNLYTHKLVCAGFCARILCCSPVS